ncbi:MAG: pyridoxal phosphate-dependent aminotransferase [Clostridia bacterium]|nr:pyridoxal phosphate-dependent aminotransferase [Clostridia bacterium]
MINRKAEKLGRERSVIREIFEYGQKRKSEIGAEHVYDFSLGNPSVSPPPSVDREIVRLIEDGPSTSLHGYTSASGAPETRRAIAEYLTRTHGFSVSGDSIYVTVGAAAALTSALGALVTKGEEVIVLAPYFPEYKVFIEKSGGRAVEVPSCPDFQPNIEAIKEAITPRTAAIIVNSPNNPSGAVITRERLEQLASVLSSAEAELGKSIYLIADEPYRELVYDGAEVPFIPSIYRDTVVCYSFSKSLSLPGERIGYVLVSPSIPECDSVFAAVAGAARSLGYVCAPSLMQRILPKVLGEVSDIAVYDRNRRLLLSELSSYGFECVPPSGAFYLFLKSPVPDANEFAMRARDFELLLVPSDSFGCPGYVRISYCVETEEIKRALPAFSALAKSYGLKG